MSFGDKVTGSAWIATVYTPFSDRLTTYVVNPKSLLGTYLVHNLRSVVGAGVAGFTISVLAERSYQFVESKCFSNSCKENSFVKLSMRCIANIVVGGALGFGASFIPSLGVTAATGVAVGAAAFIGPQLMRLIYKIVAKVFTTIMQNATMQKTFPKIDYWLNEQTLLTVYEALNLGSMWTYINWNDRYFENETAFPWLNKDGTDINIYAHMEGHYHNRDAILSWVNGDIDRSLEDMDLYKIYHPLQGKTKEERLPIIKKLIAGLEKMTNVIKKYTYSINPELLQALSMRVAHALVHDKMDMIKKDNYAGFFANMIAFAQFPITATEAKMIDEIFDAVSPLITK